MAEFQRTRAASVLGPDDRLLTGGIAIASHDGVHVDGAANSVYALAQGGRIIGRYDKAHLVPYGEYLPMRPLLSAIGLSRLAPGDIDFTPGPGPRTIDIGGEFGKVGFQLCYEMIFSGHVVDEHNRPGFIFNPSNDAWFGSWGPPQHLAQARLRAAEEGIPVLRSTPTGISAVIDGHGNVVKELPWRTAGVIDAVLPAAAVSPPLFARFGNVIPLLLGIRARSSAALCSDGADAKASYKDFLISLKSRTRLRLCAAHICSRPNPFRKAIPTRSPTRFRTRSSTCSCPRTPKRGSPARR